MKYLKHNQTKNIQLRKINRKIKINNLISQKLKKIKGVELKSHYRNKFLNITNKYVNVFLRRGLKLQIKKNICIAFSSLFFLLKNKEYQKLDIKQSEKNFLNLIKNYQNNFYCINNTIESLLKPIESTFILKCENTPKKKRRKEKYKLKLIFLKKKLRKNIALKWFYLNTVQQNTKFLKTNITKHFLSLLLQGEDSLLFRRKIQTYKKILQKLKNTK